MLKNKIIISDLHIPYQHPDAFRFLEEIRDQYEIVEAKNVGDVVDNHTPSFHEIEYGCLSPRDEYLLAGEMCRELAELFPKMDISIGNHDELPNRKAKMAGIPNDCIVDFNKRYGVNWNWKPKHYFQVDKYNKCLMTHTISTNTLNNAKQFSHCSLQGHHHSSYGLEYFSDHETLRWAMTVGCLINDKSPAFSYNKRQILKRPILGCGAIIEGMPLLIPMRLKKNGRWDGSV